jgi:integrase
MISQIDVVIVKNIFSIRFMYIFMPKVNSTAFDKKVNKKEELENVKNKIDEASLYSGLDKGLDYLQCKNKIVDSISEIQEEIERLDPEDTYYERKMLMKLKRIIYLMIAATQLKNGSRISEAVRAFYAFVDKDNFTKREIVKISKSDCIKYKDGKAHKLKARFREMVFPNWISVETFNVTTFRNILGGIDKKAMQKRVLDYLRNHFKWNTHSLRYATINYLINDQKIPVNNVSKFVGHSSMKTIMTYTQNKEVSKILDLDI